MCLNLQYNVNTVYFAGDLHGEYESMSYLLTTKEFENCLIVCCGDIGLGFNKLEYYKQIFGKINNKAKKKNVHFALGRGNHDDPSYFEEQKINLSNIKSIPDYTVLTVSSMGGQQTRNILYVGGAYSIDRAGRIVQNERELTSYKRFHNCSNEEALKNYRSVYWENEPPVFNIDNIAKITDRFKIDVIASHTCPSWCEPTTKGGVVSWSHYDSKILDDVDSERKVMDDIYNALIERGNNVQKWFYGHYHYYHNDEINGVNYIMLDMVRRGRMFLKELPID